MLCCFLRDASSPVLIKSNNKLDQTTLTSADLIKITLYLSELSMESTDIDLKYRSFLSICSGRSMFPILHTRK